MQKKQRGSKWVHGGLRSPTAPCAGPAPRSALKCRANAVMGRESKHRCSLGPDKLDRIFSLDIGIFDLNPAPSTRAPTLRPRARHLGDTQGVLCRVNTGFCQCGGAPQQYRYPQGPDGGGTGFAGLVQILTGAGTSYVDVLWSLVGPIQCLLVWGLPCSGPKCCAGILWKISSCQELCPIFLSFFFFFFFFLSFFSFFLFHLISPSNVK